MNQRAITSIVFSLAVHCEWDYETCDPCNATCGSASRTCYPRITQPAQFGGQPCPPFVRDGVPRQEDCLGLPACQPQLPSEYSITTQNGSNFSGHPISFYKPWKCLRMEGNMQKLMYYYVLWFLNKNLRFVEKCRKTVVLGM